MLKTGISDDDKGNQDDNKKAESDNNTYSVMTAACQNRSHTHTHRVETMLLTSHRFCIVPLLEFITEEFCIALFVVTRQQTI